MKKSMLTLFFIENWILDHYSLMRVLQRFLHKSISPFQKWTKKMSKIENPKYFCAKSVAFPTLTENITKYILIILLLLGMLSYRNPRVNALITSNELNTKGLKEPRRIVRITQF
jgi:hypothetical protein